MTLELNLNMVGSKAENPVKATWTSDLQNCELINWYFKTVEFVVTFKQQAKSNTISHSSEGIQHSFVKYIVCGLKLE